MNQHFAHGCAEKETTGFQRRNMLKSAAACLTLGGLCTAMARQHGNILEHSGDAQVNGQQLVPGQSLQTGDQIQTGPGAGLIFVIGDSAFKVGENSELSLERGNSLQTVSQLRLLKGAVLSVWGKGSQCQIVTPTLTAGFRGGAVYTEVSVKSRQRSYLCNCYGTLALSAGKEKTVSASTYHQAFWSAPGSSEGEALMPADSISHTDGEVEFLARLIEQKTAWQISGTKEDTGGTY